MGRRLVVAVLLLAASTGCAADKVAEAILMTGLAATAAGISRAQGGCYAACPPGTLCNTVTGLCDAIPCRGQCGHGQRCERTPIEHCVLDKPAQMQLDRSIDHTGVLIPAAQPEAIPPPAPPGQQ